MLHLNFTFLSRKALHEPYAKVRTQIILNLAVKFLILFPPTYEYERLNHDSKI